MPAARSGAAVTGPTHAASTGPRNSRNRCGAAGPASRTLVTAGALVNVTASTWPASTCSTSRRTGAVSSGAVHRYTGTSTTSAPAERSAATNSACGPPCNCTAIRCPATPDASSSRRISSHDSVGADHASDSPAARIAPHSLGPARDQPGPPQHRAQHVADPPTLGGLEPAAEADAGGRHHDVRRSPEAQLGGGVQGVVVEQRHDRDGRRADHAGAAPAQQHLQLIAATLGGHADREPGQGGQRAPGAAAGAVVISDTGIRSSWVGPVRGRPQVDQVRDDDARQVERDRRPRTPGRPSSP